MTALFDAVLQRPDDLQLRHVLADSLQEVGDPRGEFIALQLARDASGERPSKREKELWAAHSAQWLGRLASLSHEVKFERGFAHSVHLHFGTTVPAGAERWSEWATVGVLDCRSLDERYEVQLLGSPMMLSLKEVNGVSVNGLSRVAQLRGPLPWRSLSVTVQFELATLLKCALPALTSLRFYDQLAVNDFSSLIRSPLGRQLETLAFKLPAPGHLNEVMALALSSSLTTLKVTSSGGEGSFELATRTLRGPVAFIGAHQLSVPGVRVVTS